MQKWMVYWDLHGIQYSHHILGGNIERGRKTGFAISQPGLINKSISVWGEKASTCETTDEPSEANYVIVDQCEQREDKNDSWWVDQEAVPKKKRKEKMQNFKWDLMAGIHSKD